MTKLRCNSAAIKHSLTGTLLTLGLLMTETNQAIAATITTTLTADNYYGLYYGNADGSDLTFVGRNGKGTFHVPDKNPPVPLSPCSGLQWACPEAWEFNMDPGDYIYVLAWDYGGLGWWLGEFQTPDGLLLSNTSDWEYTTAGPHSGISGDLPSLTDVKTQIASATWSTPQFLVSNNPSSKGTISQDISLDADYLWSNGPNHSDFLIFRTKKPVVSETVPEPSSLLGLLAFGAVGTGSLLKRKLQKKASLSA
ncbi:MAG: PEP-CTERM sorting domain-containing protein [Hormoscilla sp.]